MNFLLEINYAEKLPPADALSFGLTNVLLGVGTVFAVLILLQIILLLFKVVFHDIPNRSKNKKSAPQTDTPVAQPKLIQPNAEDEIVAVIAAAIAAAESESGGVKFRVVSFRKK